MSRGPHVGAQTGGESLNVRRNSFSRSVPAGDGLLWKSPFKALLWIGDDVEFFPF